MSFFTTITCNTIGAWRGETEVEERKATGLVYTVGDRRTDRKEGWSHGKSVTSQCCWAAYTTQHSNTKHMEGKGTLQTWGMEASIIIIFRKRIYPPYGRTAGKQAGFAFAFAGFLSGRVRFCFGFGLFYRIFWICTFSLT